MGIIWVIVTALKKDYQESVPSQLDDIELLSKLAEMKDKGIITKEEFETKKTEIMDIKMFASTRRLAFPAITKVTTCAIGTASQTPVSFSIGGRIRSISSVQTGSAYTRR